MRKTAYLYVLKEILPISFLGVMIFTIILLMDKILKLIELIVTRGVSVWRILMLLLFISPSFLTFTVPISVLLGTLLGIGRLSSDSEITAFKASGISLYQLYIPIFALSMAAYLFTTFLVLYGLPWGNRGFRATLYLIAQSRADVEIKERVFNDVFDGLVIYVDKVPVQGKKMEGILIYDEREKGRANTIFAKEGFVVNDPKSHEVALRLIDGDIHRYEPKSNVYQRVQFSTYDLRLELAKIFVSLGKKLKEHEMSVEEIKEKMAKMKQRGENTTPQEIEIHKRYAIPFVCLVFGLVGLPLGIQPRRSGRSHGFVFSILILLAYYIALTSFEILANRHVIPPAAVGWAPNILFGALGVYLLVKSANETPVRVSLWVSEATDFLQRKWKGLFEDA
jgi:lipopolysaccharide export system permease protein